MTAGLLDAAAAAAHPAWGLGNLLDVRPAAAFADGHVAGALNRPLPASPWTEGTLAGALPPILLPPRHEPLLVLADRPAAARAARDFLRLRGRPGTDGCVLDAAMLAGLPAGMAAAGPGVAGLWRPPAFLWEHAALLPPPAAGPVLDLGAGSGRAAVWLAARGYAVTAVERLPDALARAELLARAAGVDPSRLALLARDLREPVGVPPGPWAIVLSLRFLDRPLLRRLAPLLQPGGVAVVRTFRHAPGRTDLPRPKYRLVPGELLQLLPDPPFETLVHREDHDPDGRAAAGIVARRRG